PPVAPVAVEDVAGPAEPGGPALATTGATVASAAAFAALLVGGGALVLWLRRRAHASPDQVTLAVTCTPRGRPRPRWRRASASPRTRDAAAGGEARVRRRRVASAPRVARPGPADGPLAAPEARTRRPQDRHRLDHALADLA